MLENYGTGCILGGSVVRPPLPTSCDGCCGRWCVRGFVVVLKKDVRRVGSVLASGQVGIPDITPDNRLVDVLDVDNLPLVWERVAPVPCARLLFGSLEYMPLCLRFRTICPTLVGGFLLRNFLMCGFIGRHTVSGFRWPSRRINASWGGVCWVGGDGVVFPPSSRPP